MFRAELEAVLAKLSKTDKADLIRRLALEVADTWPGIESTAGVVGGDACIVRTRIPVWVLESHRREGWTEGRLLDNFPTLRAADLVHAWDYVAAHRQQIDDAIQRNHTA
jgi:uncharacterized protein (DUF433 family)